MLRNAGQMFRQFGHCNNSNMSQLGTYSVYGSLFNNTMDSSLFLNQTRSKHKFSYEHQRRRKAKNNQGARDRFIVCLQKEKQNIQQNKKIEENSVIQW